ncbi:DinB family protein [Pseudonocardia abyssalis]|uniref:DinB family protein n=1 Tax=Pseudonocardia abyssalis TaxID=2792008 RepID=A0ABS6UZP6_9PSEU|nr:DinB family protein [Pseudonocardia abyssalis]MBW0114519.1 DinB family protein [Pseudonocardia abyssalis]MBW0137718.1 DinB family protein [Pseudonocardia abyssalis]
MAASEHDRTDAFRGARFTRSDLSGSTFHDCDLSGVRITGAFLDGLSLSGVFTRLLVDDVDVTGFVTAELERRHPERVLIRTMRTVDEHRAAWAELERLWERTVERARGLPEAARHERVDEEWSFVETLRHLVFATDGWVGRMILEQPAPYHPLGLVPADFESADAAAGLDPDARPSFEEVLVVRAGRTALVRALLDDLTDDGLDRVCPGSPWIGDPDQPRAVRACLRVIMNEEHQHRRFAERDLAVLEAR